MRPDRGLPEASRRHKVGLVEAFWGLLRLSWGARRFSRILHSPHFGMVGDLPFVSMRQDRGLPEASPRHKAELVEAFWGLLRQSWGAGVIHRTQARHSGRPKSRRDAETS